MVQAPAVFETAALVRAWLPQHKNLFVKSLIKPFFIWVSIQLKVRVKLPRSDKIKEVNIENGTTIENLLIKLDYKPDTVIVMNNNKPLPIDDVLKDESELIIIQVSSGG